MSNRQKSLNDTQLVLLSAAAKRDDLLLFPRDDLKPHAARTLLGRLLSLGLVEEVAAGPSDPVWHTGAQEQEVAVRLTPAGLQVIGIATPPNAEGEAAEDSHDAEAPSPPAPAAIDAPSAPADRRRVEPRPGSKQELVLALIARDSGATLVELVAATGWLPHTTRAELTRLRQKGHALTKVKRDDKTASYGIGDVGQASDKTDVSTQQPEA